MFKNKIITYASVSLIYIIGITSLILIGYFIITAPKIDDIPNRFGNGNIEIIEDRETGCKYSKSNGTLSILYKSNGKPDCPESN